MGVCHRMDVPFDHSPSLSIWHCAHLQWLVSWPVFLLVPRIYTFHMLLSWVCRRQERCSQTYACVAMPLKYTVLHHLLYAVLARTRQDTQLAHFVARITGRPRRRAVCAPRRSWWLANLRAEEYCGTFSYKRNTIVAHLH